MREYLELGPSPSDENCAQVGSDNYSQLATRECLVYLNQLKRLFPDSEKANCNFRIRTFPHDFGSYKEVVIYFEDTSEASTAFAYNVQDNLPAAWDTIAKKELATIGENAMRKLGL